MSVLVADRPSAPAPAPAAVPDVPEPRSRAENHSELAERTRLNLEIAQTATPERRAELFDEAVESHLWLADSLARRYQHRGEELEDLTQVARSGLVEAVRRYDPEAGSFNGFAVPTINGVLKRHFRDHGWLVRPPRPTQEVAAQLRQQWPDLVQTLGHPPTEADLASHLGQSVAAIREATQASQSYRATSLDAITAAGVTSVADHADGDLDRAEARVIVLRAWPHLDPAEQRLLWLRFYEDRSQSDIATRIGTSQMQVSRLLARTLRRLRTLVTGSDTNLAAS